MADEEITLSPASAGMGAAGVKAAALSRLDGAGLPVPDAFCVGVAAYHRFVERAGIGSRIRELVAEHDPEEASRRIVELFERHPVHDELAGPIRWGYARLGDRDHLVAVRASPNAAEPVAGLYLTLLGVRGESGIVDAVKRCWASLWSADAIAHRERTFGESREGLDAAPGPDPGMGVVVQTLVSTRVSGTLSTVAPLSESDDRMVVRAVRDTGMEPEVLVLDKPTGRIIARRSPGPEALTTADALSLGALGLPAERALGIPVEADWVFGWEDDGPWLVDARPLPDTGDTEVWNDSLRTTRAPDSPSVPDPTVHTWTNANLGEAVPNVMTPITWSLVRLFANASMPLASLPGMRTYGRIGGRLYMDLSVAAAIEHATGPLPLLGFADRMFGRAARRVDVEPADLPRAAVLRTLLPAATRVTARAAADRRRLPDFLAGAPGRAAALHRRCEAADSPAALLDLWHGAVLPYVLESSRMLAAAVRPGGERVARLQRELTDLVGPEDASVMLTGLRSPDGAPLSALGPVIGLARYARGEIDRETYRRDWGHRGPDEFELSHPRPAEDPEWPYPSDDGSVAAELLERRAVARHDAWHRLRTRRPGDASRLRAKVVRWARDTFLRETARSEAVRALGVVRAFVLRAGELTGHGDDLFFLDMDEVLGVLDDDPRHLADVAVRRRTYDRYRALPPYPPVIYGPFDPFRWAADPARRTDVHAPIRPLEEIVAADETITGVTGSAGVAEGVVRVVTTPADSAALLPNEVLVAPSTGTGWTTGLPRAAALVTDVGTGQSHAATLAREFGLPAVVGAGDATHRLRTGDRVRVDGTAGKVDFIASRASAPPEVRPAARASARASGRPGGADPPPPTAG